MPPMCYAFPLLFAKRSAPLADISHMFACTNAAASSEATQPADASEDYGRLRISSEQTLTRERGYRRVNVDLAEAARLRALDALEILDTPSEPEFDDLVQLAAAICDSPISAISLVDQHRQWFKASVGLDVEETPRDLAFCHYTIQGTGLMVVEDATADPRFSAHPMVAGGDGWRFYAGMPLQTPEGHSVGALCVLDRTPRCLTANQQGALRVLASQVNARLELRAQRRALEQALEEAQVTRARAEALEHRFQTFMDSGPFLAFIKDADGRMLYYNEPLARQFQVSREDLLNKTDEEIWPSEMAASYREHDLEVLASGKPQICNEDSTSPDGSHHTWRSYKFPCTDARGQTLLGGIAIDVTADLRRQAELKRYQAELERANGRLQTLADLDPLTQVHNRRVFDDTLQRSYRHACETGAPLCLLMLDVDRFKSHNDRFGHAHGDHVLRTLALLLQSQLRAEDTIARYGGEEFVVLLPNTDAARANLLADRLVSCVSEFPWPVAPVTVSVGVSGLTPEVADAETLVAWADRALYAAKCAGRDCRVSHPELALLDRTHVNGVFSAA